MRERLGTLLPAFALLAGLALLGWLGWAWWQSRLPGRYDVTAYGEADLGGGPGASGRGLSVARLRGPTGRPDYRVTLTAEKASIRLASGARVDAWTFDGRSPGPGLRVHEGDLVEVTLVNRDIGDGVTIHWHGVDVPNAEDGVAGVTQDSVAPGERYVYRFRPEQVGTFWYHTHQDASKGVKLGLYGVLVILPRKPQPEQLDLTLPVHMFAGRRVIGTNDGVQRRAVRPGTPIRLRFVNTDSSPTRIRLIGMEASVAAIDGADIEPADVPKGEVIEIGAGGRYDVVFRMPRAVVSAEVASSKAALVLSPDGKGEPAAAPSRPVFDPAAREAATPARLDRFDRTFLLKISKKPGSSTEDPAATGRSTASSIPGRRCSWSREETSFASCS